MSMPQMKHLGAPLPYSTLYAVFPRLLESHAVLGAARESLVDIGMKAQQHQSVGLREDSPRADRGR